MSIVRRVAQRAEEGQTAAEYAVTLTVITVMGIAAFAFFSDRVRIAIQHAADVIGLI